MSVMSNQNFTMYSVREAGTNRGNVFHPAGVPLNNRVGLIVIVLLQKEVGGESDLNKLIKLQ